MAHPLRVQIHLNLAEPQAAENVVRLQSASGTWVGVAYATELVLTNVHPVVHLPLQERIARGDLHKVPHAFLEGDLLHFKGRWRELAPAALIQQASQGFHETTAFPALVSQARESAVGINYNPRFASCFYADQASKEAIDSRFVSAGQAVILGWKCWVFEPSLVPLEAACRCQPQALEKTSEFERRALGRGFEKTQGLIQSVDSTNPVTTVVKRRPMR